MSKLILTAAQIKSLAEFAAKEGQPAYTIAHGTIPAFEADDGTQMPEYSGLLAYSDSEKSGVLQLDDPI
ncbi:hypothetical protein [Candidatus Symbiopectobacterium sp. NZEC135]|uniref:hypothetical protein n=1 Tax=Candidatus Symbiopectobacterium sp. NZEC135 TaxID=2820471 RepID=UPI0022261C2D|nr:hypothetical protein [Candidatus Symbiopectobacterium sp. NZEC135]MCW2478837.1 hypothetical protein [Candidatus Symbiopectobacterium sp. NZEC135]